MLKRNSRGANIAAILCMALLCLSAWRSFAADMRLQLILLRSFGPFNPEQPMPGMFRGVAEALAGALVTYLLYMKLLFPVPKNHRAGMIVLLALRCAFLLLPFIGYTKMAGIRFERMFLIYLAGIFLSPYPILLIGAIAKKRLELPAAIAHMGYVIFLIATSTTLHYDFNLKRIFYDCVPALLLIAVLLLHPVLERPIIGQNNGCKTNKNS